MQSDHRSETATEILEKALLALKQDANIVVPCATCAACCQSNLTICIDADEVATLQSIPKELLKTVEGLPFEHFHLEPMNNQCPLLIDGKCSIYATRPRTCQHFDCRVVALTSTPVQILPSSPLAKKLQDLTSEDMWSQDREEFGFFVKAKALMQRNQQFFSTLNVVEDSFDAMRSVIFLMNIFAHEAFAERSDKDVLAQFVLDFRQWRNRRVHEQHGRNLGISSHAQSKPNPQ
jgi:hypothetical protein